MDSKSAAREHAMASRREVLRVLTALGVVGTGTQARAGADPALYKLIVDRRLAASRPFAEALGKRRTPIAEISGDVTDLWVQDLHRRWKQGPAAIAGLTGTDALFVLERLGWDHGLRVTSRQPVAGQPNAVAWLMAPVRRA